MTEHGPSDEGEEYCTCGCSAYEPCGRPSCQHCDQGVLAKARAKWSLSAQRRVEAAKRVFKPVTVDRGSASTADDPSPTD